MCIMYVVGVCVLGGTGEVVVEKPLPNIFFPSLQHLLAPQFIINLGLRQIKHNSLGFPQG